MGLSPIFRSLSREAVYSAAVVLPLTAAAISLILLMTGAASIRFAGFVIGAAVCAAGALIGGNPRLFCLWGLGFSIPFLFAKVFGEVLDKGGGEVAFNIDVTDVFLFALCVFLARDIIHGRRPWIRIPKVSYLWLGVMVLGVAAIVQGPYRTTAAHEVFRMGKMLVLFWVLCQELESPRRILHWCGALTSGLIVNALVGLFQAYSRTTLGLADLGEASDEVTRVLAETSVKGVEAWRVGGFMLHPNIFGVFLAAVLPLVVACFLLHGRKLYKTYYFAAFLLGAAALVATQSRSGWFSFAASLSALLAAAISHRLLRRRAIIASAFLVIALLGIGGAASGEIAARLFESKESALTFRGVFNEEAKRMIAEKPLWGFGLNSYAFELPPFATIQYGSWPPPVHNIYYLWWAETGLIGLSLHLAMWGGIALTGIRNLRVRNEQLFAVNSACLAGMVAFALDGFVSFSLRLTPALKTFWVLAAIIMAVRYWRLRHEVAPFMRETGAFVSTDSGSRELASPSLSAAP